MKERPGAFLVECLKGTAYMRNRFKILSLCLAAALACAGQARAYVLTGLDAAEQHDFDQFAGKRVGLITNQTGVEIGRASCRERV